MMNRNTLALLLFATFAAVRVTAVPTNAIAQKTNWSAATRGVSYRLNEAAIRELQAAAARPTIQSREVVDGNIIESWKSGPREWAVTNALVPVIGRKLDSTFTERVRTLEAGWTNAVFRAEIAEKLAARREAIITAELARLREDKTELEDKISDAAYLLLRPWLRLKLAAVELRIKALEDRVDD